MRGRFEQLLARLPLTLRRRYCRLFGHVPVELVKYTRHRVLHGKGCGRCDHGDVSERRRHGPLPHPDYRRQMRLP